MAGEAREAGHDAMAWVAPIVTALACLLVWEAAIHVFKVPIYLLPPPSDVLRKMLVDYRMFYTNALPTLSAIVLGFGMAVAVGVPIATFMVYSKLFRNSIQGILITAQVLPKVLMTFLIAFFPIVIDSVVGLASVRPESLMLVRSMGAGRWQAFWKVRLPQALPSMFGGFKVAITFAVVGTLVAEFVGSDSGLGYVLVMARGNLDTLTVFATIGWLVVIGFLFYYAVELLERFVLRHRGQQRAHELGAGL